MVCWFFCMCEFRVFVLSVVGGVWCVCVFFFDFGGTAVFYSVYVVGSVCGVEGMCVCLCECECVCVLGCHLLVE